MWSLREPDAEHLSHFLARQRQSPFTYSDIGASVTGAFPHGYHHASASIDLGSGDDVWNRARAGMDTWVPARSAGLHVVPDDAPVTVGTTVAFVTRVGLAYVTFACRIVAHVDEADRYGFAYGTLPEHPEEGEELFLVTRAADGTVRFEITAFSRPHDLLTRLGGRVARRVQARTTQRYLSGLRSYVNAT
jgi:uncharacterized protein (UPF0548 family)